MAINVSHAHVTSNTLRSSGGFIWKIFQFIVIKDAHFAHLVITRFVLYFLVNSFQEFSIFISVLSIFCHIISQNSLKFGLIK
ncbi:MAG: hypothetical protein WCG25_02020 [bacterium]